VGLGVIVSANEDLGVDVKMDVNVDVDENLHVSLTVAMFPPLVVSLPVYPGWI
jgi:hypothetical protein